MPNVFGVGLSMQSLARSRSSQTAFRRWRRHLLLPLPAPPAPDSAASDLALDSIPRMPRPPHSVPPTRAASRARVAAPGGRVDSPVPRPTAPLRRAPPAAPATSPSPVSTPARRRPWRWLRWGDHRHDLGRTRPGAGRAVVRPRPAAPGLGARRHPPPQPDPGGPHRPRLRPLRRRGRRAAAPDRHAALPAARPSVAVEDRRFWHHSGIDLIGLARAAWTDLMSGHVVQGGSHPHPAGRQEPVPVQCAHSSPQGAGTAADFLAGTSTSPSAKSSRSI